MFKIIVAISPSQAWKIRSLKCEQTELLHLIQSAKNSYFIDMIAFAVENAAAPLDLYAVKEQLQTELSNADFKRKM